MVSWNAGCLVALFIFLLFCSSLVLFSCVFFTRQDPLTESFYYGAAKVVEKSLTHLLTAKAVALGDNVIPRGELAEVTASCTASVAALWKVVYAWEEDAKW